MRKVSKLVIGSVLLGLAAVASWTIFSTPGLHPVLIEPYQPPIIQAENRIVDIGKVPTDGKSQAAFILYNVGGKHLRIGEVETSCGCTVAQVSKRIVPPGDFTRLSVDLDTSIKIGAIRKKIAVKSNDPNRPVLNLFLTGTVLPKKMESHADITLKAADPLVLFKGTCASCHVANGKGKTGQPLFLADCAMCHGINGQGNKTSGVSLLNGNYDDPVFRDKIRKIIAEGSPNSPQMPPFSDTKGGPLNDSEIDSLVQFLKIQSLQKKMGLLGADMNEQEDEAAFQAALKQPH